ncbi:hypothetical protein SAMN05421833_13353 [Microbispora rosea]|uniref:Uncharacterized protein n=1 Tax=Microbispora rosea TaxID=58117 RepID=A0A1N7GW51_9ACTN|nr:hypothetical protein SAMN05421833_13353 [Microbispora rosea]
MPGLSASWLGSVAYTPVAPNTVPAAAATNHRGYRRKTRLIQNPPTLPRRSSETGTT